MVKKVVIIGPESTGKSTLCELLAKHYNTVWCPEYAREYLTEHGAGYTFDDLLTIARGQVALEETATSEGVGPWLIVYGENQSAIRNLKSPIFIDTDLYVMKVWCEFVFNKCHTYILEQIAKRKYDLYLLCNIDLPWTHDPLREYPDEKPRQELYCIYKDILINQHTPWVEISGSYNERIQTAVAAINKLLDA